MPRQPERNQITTAKLRVAKALLSNIHTVINMLYLPMEFICERESFKFISSAGIVNLLDCF